MSRRQFLVLLSLTMSLSTVLIAVPTASAVAPANAAFQRTWEHTDQPVLDGQVARTWMWGPKANTGILQEPYAEAPDGSRQVQYYDKARMEITHPDTGDPNSIWYVTNGLLVVEMITGQMQVGDATFEERGAAAVNVAGDANDPDGPTYVSFAAVLDEAAYPPDTLYTTRINRDGSLTDDPALQAQGVTAAIIDEVTTHSIATPFWDFMRSSGLVYEAGAYIEDQLFENPYFATGRPITEAYWASVRVAGTPRDVLIQCFERRCLTYTPGNPEGFVVEAGNVGQHYFAWRYESEPPEQPEPPEPPADDGIPAEGEVLYESSLSEWPANTSDSGAVGTPLETTGYGVVGSAGSAYYVFNAGPYGDASYSVSLFSIDSSGDVSGCLVVRAALDQGAYHLCVAFSQGNALGTLAFYLKLDGSSELVELALHEFEPAKPATDLHTIKLVAQGDRFWFFADGAAAGSATHNGSLNGLAGLGMLCIDEMDACGVGFRDLVIRALASDGNADPPPPPAASAELEVPQYILREASYGDTTYVNGELLNSGDQAAQNIDLVVTIYDNQGAILASESVYDVLPIIPAGSKSPFEITFFDVAPEQIGDVRFQVQWEPFDPNSFDGSFYSVDFETLQVDWNPDRITGEIRNAGDTTTSSVSVLVIGYRGDGSIFGVETTYADVDDILPGGTSPFTIDLYGSYDGAGLPISVEAYAYGVVQD